MQTLTLRKKFAFGVVAVVVVSLLVLVGGRLLARGASFHYLERQHLASVMKAALLAERAGNPATPVPKRELLEALAPAAEIAGRAGTRTSQAELVLIQAIGFGQLYGLTRQVAADIDQVQRSLGEMPGDKVDAAQAVGLQLEIGAVLVGAERFAVLTAEMVAFIQALVMVLNLLGAIALIAVFWAIRRAVLGPLESALQLAHRIAGGDLSGSIQVARKDEIGRLMEALRDMQANLAGMVEQLRLNSERLQHASSEIARGNGDLGLRTENQASALEETAASMEELGTAIKQNAANAQVASELAMKASTVAHEGGEAVARVVETMRGMNDAARSIGEITGLIDGIAFQTNILALNAAVEAARAGEQGRGFAVVAGEVRVLAARSAEAARDIKALIATTTARVQEGTALADRAGATMGEVVGSIGRVSDLVGEISAATTEQSLGVNQVGSAVSQMDGVTQQNAALVGELSAAATGLKQQAQELVEAMGMFRLRERGTLVVA
ncbi:methyl-accepting chemotaxis protein [Ramlibacter sp. XY19]|uniref:methyl-accepting chemotaxis protein n=1 Tax=Ramlibacter paludis TaxID=2908000 RepID=UPI0023DCA47E|nr:methyl-accepting chemotaxis protein [Ramlibacter paludis]MCG2592939.1 methyl-accepting chemotaxis protein [Ramlibacter paludis]